jgi:predicted RNA-binding protein YlqC (UPF0109 family)
MQYMDTLERDDAQADDQTDDELMDQAGADESAEIEDDDDLEDDGEQDGDEDEEEIQPRGEASIELEELVQFIASRLVHDPETVAVESEFRGGTVYISLKVPETEMGRVIGREGRTAKAIRTLVSIAGSRHNVHARLDIDG